jgi:hypothetical protein
MSHHRPLQVENDSGRFGYKKITPGLKLNDKNYHQVETSCESQDKCQHVCEDDPKCAWVTYEPETRQW